MNIGGFRNWNEEKIWESLLDENHIISPILNPGLVEWWEEKIGIRKEDYIKMIDVKLAIILNDWDKHYSISSVSKTIEYLEDILKRPSIHPIQKKAAKVLKDKLKIKIIEKNHDAAGWAVITEAIDKGDIDPENYN